MSVARSVSMIPNLPAISLHSTRHWKRQSQCQRLCDTKMTWKWLAELGIRQFTGGLGNVRRHANLSECWQSVKFREINRLRSLGASPAA